MNKARRIDAFQFLKTLSLNKIANGAMLRASYYLSKILGIYFHWGNIEHLSIEPTNLCNLKCPECPSGNNNMVRPRLYISTQNFKNIISEVSQHLSYLQLFFQGEPFLHPKVFEQIQFATKHKIYTSISTNGLFLSELNCVNIVKSGLHRIIISVDGSTQEMYQKYRVGGDLNAVLKGIEQLVNKKREYKSLKPYIIIQFVVFGHNEHQVPTIKKLAQKLQVDHLQIKSAQISDFRKGSNLMPKNEIYNRYKSDKNGNYTLKRTPNFKCKRIWLGGVISADNKLLPCCFDKDAKYAFGDLNKTDLSGIWKDTDAKKFRKQVWNHDSKIKMCKNCTEGLKIKL